MVFPLLKDFFELLFFEWLFFEDLLLEKAGIASTVAKPPAKVKRAREDMMILEILLDLMARG